LKKDDGPSKTLEVTNNNLDPTRSTDLAKAKAIRATEHAAEIMFEGLPMAADRLHSEIEEAANDRPASYRRGEIKDVQKRHAALVG
jgi:uncharacterized protein YggE